MMIVALMAAVASFPAIVRFVDIICDDDDGVAVMAMSVKDQVQIQMMMLTQD